MRTPNFTRTGTRRTIVWAVVALALVTVVGLRATNVIGPKPCTACHDTQGFRAATQASAHASVDCESCHMSPGTVGEMSFALQRPFHSYLARARAVNRGDAAVPNARCAACHADALAGVVTSNGISINHATCAVNASCTDCHSAVAHGVATSWVRSYDMDRCLGCHVASGKVACDLCHEGRRPSTRVRFATWTVTHGPKWRTTHGMGDVATCTVCHTSKDCAGCHGAGVPHEAKFIDVHSAYAQDRNAKCSSCHEAAFCSGCHGVKMPHPVGFTRRHAAAATADPESCKRCHADTDCTNCHVMHVHPGGAVSAATPVGGVQ